MRIYTPETVIEVTDEEIAIIDKLVCFADENELDYEDFYYLLENIANVKGVRGFCDSCDRTYSIKRVENTKEI